MAADPELLKRITYRPEVLGGKPIIRDMRMAVEHVLGKLSVGETPEYLVAEYEILEPEDIRACLLYAVRRIASERLFFSGRNGGMERRRKLLKRITIRMGPEGGKPTIRGMPIEVTRILELMAEGETERTILERYESLEPEDIQACLIYAYRHATGDDDLYDLVTLLPAKCDS